MCHFSKVVKQFSFNQFSNRIFFTECFLSKRATIIMLGDHFCLDDMLEQLKSGERFLNFLQSIHPTQEHQFKNSFFFLLEFSAQLF